MKYLLCLDKNYDIKISDYEDGRADLEQMLDNMIDLLRSYGIDDSEILDNILNDTCASIEREEN